jgi:hypothetical protein
MKYSILLFSISLVSNISVSQTKAFVSGYYINQRGDTVVGYGSFKYESAPVALRFKSQMSDIDVSNISFDSCKMIYLADEMFVTWNGKRSMTYVDKNDFTIKNIDSSVVSCIPLKLIFKGKLLSLYHYYDVKDHFFVGDERSIEELAIGYAYITDWEKRLYVRNTPTYFTSPFYRNQIISRFESKLTRKHMNLLEHTDYDKISLVKLFKVLNQ